MKKFKGEWLFDGEYITRDKQNRPIKLFKAFDVYYAGNTTPQPIYQRPFIGENPTDISRYDVLNTLEDLLYLDVQPEWTPEYESDFDDYYDHHTFEVNLLKSMSLVIKKVHKMDIGLKKSKVLM